MSTNRVRVHVESTGVGNIASSVIRNNSYIIANLLVLRKTCLRIERIADRNISRPGRAGIRAPRIKHLRIDVVRCVPCVIPDSVKPSVGGYCERAKPVPFALGRRVIVDPMWRSEGLAAVGATHKHNVCRAAPGG